jgi:hypothetical protein
LAGRTARSISCTATTPNGCRERPRSNCGSWSPVPELADGRLRPWSARLFYAYGDALLAAGRPEAAREAFSRAVVADEDEQTDALARLDELDGITVEDLEDIDDRGDLDDEDEDEGDFEDENDLAEEDEDDLDADEEHPEDEDEDADEDADDLDADEEDPADRAEESPGRTAEGDGIGSAGA